MGGEQVRENAGHRAPVLHHVGHPGRRAQVVFEHPEVALGVADQVDARDVDAYSVGRHDADCLPMEMLTGRHQHARGGPPCSRDPPAAEITRGTRSNGNGRSWPDSEKVMPWSVNARPSASARASRSEASEGAGSV